MNASGGLEELTLLLRRLDAAARDRARLQEFLDCLLQLETSPFAGWVDLRFSDERKAWVVYHVGGSVDELARGWARWPLHRLYSRHKPQLILHPSARSAALGVPLCYERRRCAIVAPLRDDLRGVAPPLVTALECVTIPHADEESPPRADVPATPLQPKTYTLGLNHDLRRRVASTLLGRGWNVVHANARYEIHRALAMEADVLVVDLRGLDDPVRALESIHRRTADLPLQTLAFHSSTAIDRTVEPFVDRFVPADASSRAILAAVKSLALEAARIRRKLRGAATSAIAKGSAQALSLGELAEFGADRAASMLTGWAAVFFCNEYGTIYQAERPGGLGILRRLPSSIFNETPLFEIQVSEAFLESVSEEPRDRAAIASLAPLSGAIVPLKLAGGARGVLVACSRRSWVDSESFEALLDLAKTLEIRFEQLRPRRASLQEFRKEAHWERFRDRTVRLDVYRSDNCDVRWRYRNLDETSALLTLGLSDDDGLFRRLTADGDGDGSSTLLQRWTARDDGFAGVIDFGRETIRYSTRGFSPPMALEPSGPSGTIRGVMGQSTGVAHLEKTSRLVVCDGGLLPWFAQRWRGDANVAELLDRELPMGLASILTIG